MHTIQPRLLPAVLVLVLVLLLALARPVAGAPVLVLLRRQSSGTSPAGGGGGSANSSSSNSSNTANCGFNGDGDMYGLGIRLGYYIQWLATVFGAYFTPKVVSSAFEANAIFNIGMLAGLLFSTIRRKNMHILDPLIVLGFSVGGAVVGLLDPKNVHRARDIRSLRARLLHLSGTAALYLPLLAYWLWYAFHGFDTMASSAGQPGCVSYTFMLAKIDARSLWFRIFLKVSTVATLVAMSALGLGLVVVYCVKSHKLPRGPQAVAAATAGAGSFGGMAPLQRPPPPPPRLSRTATALALRARPSRTQFAVVVLVCTVCALNVELTIVWNRIAGVNVLGATGQLIPMVIGILTCLRVAIGIVTNKCKDRTQRRKERQRDRVFGGGIGRDARGSTRRGSGAGRRSVDSGVRPPARVLEKKAVTTKHVYGDEEDDVDEVEDVGGGGSGGDSGGGGGGGGTVAGSGSSIRRKKLIRPRRG